MSRSDDSNGFPPGRRRRPHPPQATPDWPSGERGGDWRYPDPVERYSQNYDDHDGRPPRDPFADEWHSAPQHSDPRGHHGFPGEPEPAAPAWSDEQVTDDPFDWNAPEPPADPGWGADSYADDTENYGREAFGARDPWGQEDDHYDAGAPQRPSLRDDSLFRRIDGSAQAPDLSALTGREDLQDDGFGPDLARDPSELRDQFFSRAETPADPYAAPRHETPPGNVFDFDPRQPQLDDPYGWDDYDDEASQPAPQAAAPAGRQRYDDAYDPYAYDADPHLHGDDDMDADFLDDEPDEFEEPVHQPKGRRKLMVAGVLVAAVATGGASAFVYKTYQSGGLGDINAPTLLADSGPVKGEPSDPGGKEFPDGNKQIYDRLSGEPAESDEDTGSVSDGETDTASIPGIVTTGAEAPADTLDERIAAALRNSGSSSGTGADPSADSDSPRSVRTLTVRPDGSVVPSQAQPTSAQTSEPDNAPTVQTAGIISTSGIGGDQDTANEESSSSSSRSETSASSGSDDPAPRPERAQQGSEETEAAEETRVASAEPVPSSSTQPSTASANPYFVQIAARRDQTSALAAFADLQQKYPSILDGLAPTIKKADLGDKGIWYRLWVGPMDTRSNAQDVCGKLKQAGLGGCFVRTE